MHKALLAGQATPWPTPIRAARWRTRLWSLAALLWLLTTSSAWAQTYLIGTNRTTCAGTIYDSGGASGNYGNNQNLTTVLTPATAGAKIQLVFSAFATEATYDFLRIYDGPTSSATLLGEYTGTTSPGTITATNATGQLTLVFTSDFSGRDAGFAASISCVANVPTITSFTPTSGTTGTVVTITGTNFTGATGVSFGGVAATSFTVNSATSITVTVPPGAYTGPIRVTTPTATASSSTDFSTQNIPIGTNLTTCAGSIYDSGGPSGSYGNNENRTSVLTPGTAGLKVQLVFSAFATEATYDFLRIYDGPTSSATLLGEYTGTTSPGTVTATNATGQLTLVFTSDNGVSDVGFAASIGCVTNPPTITSFTPTSGLPGDAVTITGTNFTGATAVSFNNVAATSFTVNSATSITATVPTGATTGRIRVTTPVAQAISSTDFTVPAPTVTSFTPTSGTTGTVVTITGTNFTGATGVSFGGTAAPGFIVNSATSITVSVPTGAYTGPIQVTTPAGSGTSSGTFDTGIVLVGTNVTTCAGSIYDSGGASGNYGNNENRTSVLTPGTAGQKVQLVFSAFATEATYDFLRIYDGPTSAAPLIGEYTGSTSPGTITATNATGQLTLVFTSDVSSVDVGFAASISCVATAPTITSFTPTSGTTGTVVTITGTNFTGATAVSFGGTAAPGFTVNSATSITVSVPAGALSGPIRVTTPVATASSSTSFNTGTLLIGTNLTACSGTIYDSGGASGNYGNNENRTSVLTPATAGQRVQLVFSAFATESGYDYLRIYDGPTSSATLLGEYTGSTSPGTVTASATNSTGQLTLVFTSDGTSVDAGFAASISCVAPPSCSAPTSVSIGSITQTSASISFTAGIGNTGYTVTYTPQGGSALTATGTTSPVTLSGLTPGTQYSVTVTGNCSGGQTATSTAATFQTPFTPPANDECAGAIGLTSATTCTATTGSTLGATASTAAGSCAGTADDDVWYSFVANGTTHTITVVGNSSFDAVVNLRAGACPGTTVGSCADNTGAGGTETITATSLTPGATYYVRVYSYSSTTPTDASTGGFTICVTEPAPCAAPTALAAGSVTSTAASLSFTAGNGNTSYTVTYTPQGGSATTVTPAPTTSPVSLTGLTPSTQYTVTVVGNCSGGQTSTTASTTFTTLAPPPANDECAAATPISSIGVGTCGTAVSGTNVGATASAGAPAPGCASYSGGDVWFSLTVPANGIVQVTTDQGSGTSISDTGLALYSGACGSLTLISCDDDSGPGAFSQVRATGLTPGSTIYARVWEYSNDTFGSFSICAQTDPACAAPTALSAGSITSTSASLSFTAGTGNTSYTVTYTPQGGSATTVTPAPTASPVALTGLTPSTQYSVSVVGNCSGGTATSAVTTTFTTLIPPPANDECAAATPISSIGVGTCGTAVSGTNVGATASAGAPAPGCASYSGGDVWFSLTVPANGIVQVTTDQGSGTSISDTGLALYSGACGSLTLISCDDDSGPGAFSQVRATGLTPGSTIYARVWEYSNDAFGSFSICAQTDAPNLTVSSVQGVQGTYNNVTITSGGAARLTGPLTVSGTLTVQDGGILATNCQPVTGSGSFVLLAGGHLRICDAAGISTTGATGAIQLTGTRSFSNDAIYAYNGSTSGQVTGSGLPSRARALIVRNGNGLTLSGPLQLGQGILLNGGDLATNGNALTLLSSANGTALVVNRNGQISGNVTVQRYIDPSLNSGPGYRHYSAPVTNTTVADLTTGGFSPVVNQAYNTSATPNLVTPFPTVFGYDEARVLTSPATTYGPFDKGWVSPAATTDAMTPGRGYTVNIAASQTVDFVGTQGNGPVVRALSRTGGANGGLHLVGNPYPAPIDWSQLTVPTGLDNAMYVYQSNSQYGGVYRSYVNGFGNPRIATGQGFFVRVSPGSSAAVLTMTNAIRDTSFVTGPSFNRGVETRPVVQLTLTRPGAALADETYVYFENGASTGVDARYDALKLQHNSGGAPSVYALTAGAELSINGLPELTARTVVPLGIDVPQAGSYSFEAAQVLNLSTAGVYLHDLQTGQYQDLRQQPRYGFTAAAAGAQNARFELVFEPQRPTASAPGLTAASVTLFPNPARSSFALLVPAVPGATRVQATLLNSLGQEVRRLSQALPTSGTRLDVDVTGLATGVYTVRLQAGAAQVTKRVVIE